MLNKKIIKKVTKDSNISIEDNGKYYSIYVDNPCCEDFSFDIEKTKDKTDVEAIINYCHNFDPEEHAAMWFGGPGAPGLRELLENSDNIAESLNNLALALEGGK